MPIRTKPNHGNKATWSTGFLLNEIKGYLYPKKSEGEIKEIPVSKDIFGRFKNGIANIEETATLWSIPKYTHLPGKTK